MFRGECARLARASGAGSMAQMFRAARLVVPPILCLLLLTGCQQKMANQPRYDPLEASDFFEDGMAARPRIAGVVARGELYADPFFETGRIGNELGDGFPLAVTREVIDRGHDRYDVYCAACHGRVGDGNGMIPARGYRRPPSLHTEALRSATTGHLYDVMTNGFGSMPPYRTMIPPHDRWAIVAYIRALQLSQSATVPDLPPAERARLLGAAPAGSPPDAAPDRGGVH
jgi:mono/diheme cytochrome c family protein